MTKTVTPLSNPIGSENSRRLWLSEIPCWKSFPTNFGAAGEFFTDIPAAPNAIPAKLWAFSGKDNGCWKIGPAFGNAPGFSPLRLPQPPWVSLILFQHTRFLFYLGRGGRFTRTMCKSQRFACGVIREGVVAGLMSVTAHNNVPKFLSYCFDCCHALHVFLLTTISCPLNRCGMTAPGFK